MAVEGRNLNLFPSHFVQHREIMVNSSNEGHAYNQQQMWLPEIPFPATLPGIQPFYRHLVSESTPPKTSINTESDLTCNIQASRKRSRDSGDDFYSGLTFPAAQKSKGGDAQFFGENILPHIQKYQIEIDAVVCEHTKKIMLELQERQKQHVKLLVAVIGETTMEILRERDDQIQKMARLNLMLQEKVKTLYDENQLWREMAETNEAAANSLRTDLQHALAEFGSGAAAAMEENEAESCGSSDHGRETKVYKEGMCRGCGERQCSVLLLPCRHLCLCSVCGSGYHLQSCPVCHSSMNATLHLNMY